MTGTDTPPRMSSSGVTIVKAVIKCAPEGKKRVENSVRIGKIL